ncbi:MAG: TrkH family potassium uptake protein, partial [Leptospiraceae bacterium]|nr:TrkH family potassium uptake protein [Leptospiraceae bacterium]
ETSKLLWLIYICLTGLETILLMIGGMSLYDAINHSFTTMSSGGFSTKQDSAVNFSPFIQYVIIFFMILAGSNFTLTYFALKGRFKKVLEDEELRYYLASILIFTLAIGGTIYFIKDLGAEKSFRDALFQVVSIITTTGYVSADYTAWNHFALTCIFILMFFGASAGSTAGGIKVVRHIILLKNSFLEFRRQIHPRAIIPVRLNRKAVSQDIVFNVIAFVMIYIMIFAVSSIILSFVGVDLITSMGAVATCLGNVGPGLGKVGPMDNFAGIPAVGKWLLSILMLMGRLELFTVLMLFSPYYWTKN